MYQYFVAGGMTVGVVQPLEVVEVEHRNAHWWIAPIRTRQLALEHIIQSAPVQTAGKLIFAHQFAHLFQFLFQIVNASFRLLDILPRTDHVVAWTQRFVLREFCLAHHVVEDLVQLTDIFRLADLLRIFVDLLMVVAGSRRYQAQSIDEGDYHVLHRYLRFAQAMLEYALLVDHFFQAACGIFQCSVADRAGQYILHAGDLATQPGVIFQQFADIFQEQFEQAQ